MMNISPPVEPHTPDAERRQLTVMFCDLVDSTAHADRLLALADAHRFGQLAANGLMYPYRAWVSPPALL